MHLVRTLPLALLALAGAVTADDYDYIRGDDIYSEDYNYGLNYDRLRSVPETPDADLGGAGASPESIGERDGAMGAGDQPRRRRRPAALHDAPDSGTAPRDLSGPAQSGPRRRRRRPAGKRRATGARPLT
ncbi:hypothetical protein HML84_10685 [Alcanivorax sp. IO_7]|nr:hypothetical protein HML84_10685 [Alcanivorax sp. IO_7]